MSSCSWCESQANRGPAVPGRVFVYVDVGEDFDGMIYGQRMVHISGMVQKDTLLK